MEATTTSETTYRAVIEHGEDGKYGYSYNAVRIDATDAFADAERLRESVRTDFAPHVDHPMRVFVQQTIVTTTTTEVTR